MDLIPKIWGDLKKLGFEGSISSFDELCKWIKKMNLIYSPPKLSIINNRYAVNGYEYKNIKHFMPGSFGDIYSALQVKNGIETTVFLKRTPQFPRTLILEAFLQQISRSVLEQYGFVQAVPEILDLVMHPRDGVMCAIECIPNSYLLSEYLEVYADDEYSKVESEHIIIEIIAQVATYIAILESTLRLNHRDLKGNNILMIAPTQEWKQTVNIKKKKWEINSKRKVIIIDFGQSCIGDSNKDVIVSADPSIMMKNTDFCPKEGRDMFLLLAHLWNNPSIRKLLSPKADALFDKWLRDKTKKAWAKDIASIPLKSLVENFERICEFVNKKAFHSDPCNPISVLEDISKAYPDIVSFSGHSVESNAKR
jgi:hypothetical protein